MSVLETQTQEELLRRVCESFQEQELHRLPLNAKSFREVMADQDRQREFLRRAAALRRSELLQQQEQQEEAEGGEGQGAGPEARSAKRGGRSAAPSDPASAGKQVCPRWQQREGEGCGGLGFG